MNNIKFEIKPIKQIFMATLKWHAIKKYALK